MPRPRGSRNFAPTKRDAIVAAWDAGERDYGSIAASAGASINSVRVYLSRAGRTQRQRSDKQFYGARAPCDLEIVAEERYGCGGNALASRILTAVADGDLYAAILDDPGEEGRW